MDIVINIVGGIALVIALLGYMYIVYKVLDIQFEFIPIFTFASISMIVYLGGIIGILLPITYAVVLIGILSFIYMILTIKKGELNIPVLWVAHALFALLSLVILIVLLNMKFVEYSDFSQWGISVKEMMITNKFPTSNSGSMVENLDTPLGATSFIYFVCKFVGDSQGVMLCAQALLVLACFYAIFGIIRERMRFQLYSILGAGLSLMVLFNRNTGINSLDVAFLMPMLALVGIAIIVRYKEDVNKLYVLICPVIGLLVVTNNSGVIFAMVTVLYLFYAVNKYGKATTRRNVTTFNETVIYSEESSFQMFIKSLFLVMISFSTAAIWQLHIMLEFPELNSILGIDVNQIVGTYTERTVADIQEIMRLFVAAILDFTSPLTIGWLLFEAIGLIACVIAFCVLKKKWKLPLVFVLMNLYLVLFYVGVEHYISSGFVLFAGVIIICLFTDIEKTMKNKWNKNLSSTSIKDMNLKHNFNWVVIPCMCIILGMFTWSGIQLVHDYLSYNETLAAQVESITGDSWSSKVMSEKTIVYASDQNSQVSDGYLMYITVTIHS